MSGIWISSINPFAASTPLKRIDNENETRKYHLSKSYFQATIPYLTANSALLWVKKKERKSNWGHAPNMILLKGADTIFFNRSLWQKSTFPKQVMHDAVSYREGSLMHSKVEKERVWARWIIVFRGFLKQCYKYIVATLPRSSNSNIRGWVYLGYVIVE